MIVLSEKGLVILTRSKYINAQRVLILFFHIISSLILFIYTEESFSELLIFTLGSLFLLISINIIYPIIFKNSCEVLWNCMTFILDIGLMMLFRLDFDLAQKQLLWIFISFVISVFIPYILKYMPRLDKFKYFYLALSITFLLLTLIFGITEGGSKNWLEIGSFTFQPSEMVKLFFIFYLASEFSDKITIRRLILPSVMSCIVILCLVFQKDLGSALIFFMIFMSMVYISTGNAFLVSGGFLLFGAACVVAYKLFSHVRVRVQSWLDPWSDIEGGGYQIAQSLFAIGTGGFFGSGLTKGMETSIPVVERDFIFSAICEEFGVIFAIGFITVLLLMFARGIKICLNCKNKFLCLLSSNIIVIICFQSFLIIGGVIKLIPLTGVTLPFVSYGGSSMLISFIMIAVLQWVATLKPTKKTRKTSLKKGESADEKIN